MMVSEEIQPADEPVLEFLEDIKYSNQLGEGKKGFQLAFVFGENPYFSDKVLTKTYLLDPDDEDECLSKAIGSNIAWKEGKSTCVRMNTKTQKKKGKTRTVKVNTSTNSPPAPAPRPSMLLPKERANLLRICSRVAPLACGPAESSVGSPRASMLACTVAIMPMMRLLISGRQSRMCSIRIWLRVRAKFAVPHLASMLRYFGCLWKKVVSLDRPVRMVTPSWMSFWLRFTTAI